MDVQRGNFFMLFNNADRVKRYILSILIGLPTWFVIGVLVTFSAEFGKWMNIKEEIDPGKAIMYAYAAISIGDILIGFISQWLRSRKKALYLFYVITAIFTVLFLPRRRVVLQTECTGSAPDLDLVPASGRSL